MNTETLPLTLIDGILKPNLAPSTKDPYVLLVWNQFYNFLEPKLVPILKRARDINDRIVKEDFNQEIEKIDVENLLLKLSNEFVDLEIDRIFRKAVKRFTYLIT